MKISTLIVAISFSALLITCNTNENVPSMEHFKTIRGGCADGLPPSAMVTEEKTDTIYHYIDSNYLNIYVGFVASCCIQYSDKAYINGNKITLLLDQVSSEPCDCICYYEFTFKFKELEKKTYNYVVKINGIEKFSGTIDLRQLMKMNNLFA